MDSLANLPEALADTQGGNDNRAAEEARLYRDDHIL